jgi:hypothetical protein
MKLFKKIFASEDEKGARSVSKTDVPCPTHGAGASSRPRYWVASHWDHYMARHGWKQYPCVKHAVEFCLECTATNMNGVCVE